MIRVPVGLGRRAYEVLVGHGVRNKLRDVLPRMARRAALVTQEGVPRVDPGIASETFMIAQGESAKTLATVESLCRDFSKAGISRADVVVAVGGGVVTDTAGFAAAVFHRGIPLVNVATSLIGQVDAAIGGKTGVNLPEGKNLVGAFWQPSAVVCDTELLETLPEREFRSGLGEMAKYRFLGVEDLQSLPLADRIARCIELKARVVVEDERDGSKRALLNYGHTLAHALETVDEYDIRHGEAVAIGLVFAAELALILGRVSTSRVDLHRRVVSEYGLPTSLPDGCDADELMALMARDKKALGSMTFVLDGPNGVELVDGVHIDHVAAALEAVRR